MEQEQILSNLKGGLGQTSLSDRTITDFASVLEVPEDEAAHADFFAKQIRVLKTLEGQLSHEVATKVDDFKKNYKPEDAKKEEPKKKEDEIPSWAKEFMEKAKANEQKELEAQKAAQREQVISEAYEQAKNSGADAEPVLKIVKQLIKVEDGDTALSVKSKIVELYNKTYKELYGEGAAPVFSSGGSGNKKASIERYKQHLVQSGRIKEK
jgi:hypothetical protein